MFSSEEAMAGPILECIQERIRNAEEDYKMIQQLEVSFRNGESLNKDQQRLLSSKNVIIQILEFLEHAKESSCRRIESNKHGRYLCISNGLTIVCLDLKDGLKQKPIDKLQPLPKIHTLVAAEMLSGQQKDPDLSGNVFFCFVDGANFCLFEQDTSTINTSLYLSMLEQDEGSNQIHVVETIPNSASEIPNSFLSSGDQCMLRQNQIVIADRVYSTDCDMKAFKVFNTTTLQGYMCPFPRRRYRDMVNYMDFPRIPIRHVAELLRTSFVRCIGKLGHSDSSNPLYVVIAVRKKEQMPRTASAYLVASTGQVLCYQLVPHFFGGLSKIFIECGLLQCLQGTVISADEEGKTLCAIVPVRCTQPELYFLFISTFTVEDCVYDFDNGPLLPSILARKREEGGDIWDVPLAPECHFLNVEVKEWNAYELGKADMKHFPLLSACFLSTQ